MSLSETLLADQDAPMRGLSIVVAEDRKTASLWRRWVVDRDVECRTHIFDSYLGHAKILARREYKRRPKYGLEFCDFEQLAMSGLLEAIDRYDPLAGCGFKTFSSYRIIGSIADGLSRSSDGAAAYRAQRSMERDRLKSLRIGEIYGKTDPIAALSELVGNLAITVLLESVAEISVGKIADDHTPDGYENLRWNEMSRLMRDKLKTLPEQERQIVQRHYLEGMSFAQIADLLELSRGRISQIHKAAVAALRDGLKRYR